MIIKKIQKKEIEDKYTSCIDGSVLNVDCAEISLKSHQFCNLTEVNLSNVKDQKDLENRVKYATILGTVQATYTEFHYLNGAWQDNTEEDALLGVSFTGIADIDYKKFDWDAVSKLALETNEKYAKKLGINIAARIGTCKPSGCLIPSTKIKTNMGDMTLEEIFDFNGYKLNDMQDVNKKFIPVYEKIFVKDENNENKQISKLFVNGMSDTFEIELDDGVKITCTEEHKFLTTNRGWVAAKELQTDDDIFKY